ncbi:hypothetical protein C8Q73DRAFT_681468 [Cubamyces lactineus]|nr:hypothetical protein C8Q73DRAFT_681468 [Cubamyces lactineus]
MRPAYRFITALTLLSFFASFTAATTFIDNADPRIQYGGMWQQGSATEDDYMSTLAYSEWNSATAILVFTGISVSVFGTLKPVGTWNLHSAYSVDGASMSPYINTSPLSGEQHHVQFFSQGGLSDGTHTLTIENMGQQFLFDYVAVETRATAPFPPPAISTPRATASAMTSSTTPQQTSSPTSVTTGPPSSTSTSQPGRPASDTTITAPPSTHTSVPTTAAHSASLTSDSPITPSGTPAQSTTGVSSPSSTGQLSTETSGGPTAAPAASTNSGTSTPGQPGLTTSGISPTLGIGSSKHNKGRLSPGEIAGIAVGGAIAMLVLIAALYVGCRSHRRTKARKKVTPFVTPPRSADTEYPNGDGDNDDDTLPLWTWQASEKAGDLVAATRDLGPRAESLSALPLPLRLPLALPGAALLRNPSQTERSSAPPTVRGRVLLINRAAEDATGGGMWADYSSSMPTHSVSLGPRSSLATYRLTLGAFHCSDGDSGEGEGGGGGGGGGRRLSGRGGGGGPQGKAPMTVRWFTPDNRPPGWI